MAFSFLFALYFVNCKLYLPVLVNKALYFCLGRRLRSDGGASTERENVVGYNNKNPYTTFTPVGDIVPHCPQGGAAPG
jgi:hypothetical protein